MSVRKRTWRDSQGREHQRWMIHVEWTRPDGRRESIRRVSPVQTRRGAEAYEREVRQQLASGAWREAQRQAPTLAEFCEEFLAYQATRNKPSEIANKRSMLRVHLLPAFGEHRLDQIDERAIDAYKVAKLEQPARSGRPLKAATINKHLKLLGRIFNVAKKWKLIREVPENSLLKPRPPSFDFLDFDEAECFIEAAREHLPRWHPFVVVAIRTGLRIGELSALRWRDLDLERGRLTVQRSWHPLNGFTTPKSDKPRELPLTWDAIAALRCQRAYLDVDCELVFPHHVDPTAVMTANDSNAALAKVAKACGMRHVHNHMLRHTFASHAVMRGIPIRQVQEWLGHASITVTMRYAHLARGVGDELIRRLAPPPPEAPRSPPHSPPR